MKPAKSWRIPAMNLDGRLLHLASRERLAFSLSVILVFGVGVAGIAQADLLSRVIDRVFLKGASLGQVAWLLIALLGVNVLQGAFTWGGETAAQRAAARLQSGLRIRLYERILVFGPAALVGDDDVEHPGGFRTGELVNDATEGVEALGPYFGHYLPQLILAVVLPLTYLAFVFPRDILSGVVFLVTAPLIPLFMVLIGNWAGALTRVQWRTLSRLSAHFLDVLQGLTTLKILGRSKEQAGVIGVVSERYRRQTMGVLRVTFLSALALELVATLSTAIVAVQIGLRLLHGNIAFENALFVLLLAPEFYLPLRALGVRFHAGMSGAAAAPHILKILETPSDLQKSKPSKVETKAYGPQPPLINFEGVAYDYSPGRKALRGVSFSIQPGERVALVGPSGGGKSTLASLLLGFIQPDQGRIMIDGAPLDRVSLVGWRRQISWVSQRAHLFNSTVLENIRLGAPDADMQAVMAAARKAHAHEFIHELSQGYQTLIGERGARLSGGQAQRLVLARAFLKEAPLLVLDEATANLDPDLETLITESAGELMCGRSALIIAHRLSTIRNADRVLVLNQGEIVQSGTYQELIEGEGFFREFVRANLGNGPVGGASSRFRPGERTFNERANLASSPEIEPTGKTSWAALHTLLSFLRPYAGWIALAVTLGFATIASGVGLMAASAYIISKAALGPSIAALGVAIVGVRFFGLARGVFRYLERYVSHQVTFRLLTRLRLWFYRRLEPLAPAALVAYSGGDLLSRAIRDVASLENFYVRSLAPPLAALVSVMAMGGFFAAHGLELALSLLLFLALAGALLPVLILNLSRDAGERIPVLYASLNSAFVDGIQGLADLMVFGGGQAMKNRIAGIAQELKTVKYRWATINGLHLALSGFLAHMGMWTVLVMGIPMLMDGRMDGVLLTVLALAALASFEAVAPLPGAAQHMRENLEAGERLFEILEHKPEVLPPEESLPFPEQFDLSIRNVSFHYPHQDQRGNNSTTEGWDTKCVLDEISFELPQGARYALVGASGSGKSTLINLLLRLWDFEKGEIYLGGIDLACFDPDLMRKRLGVVPQNPHLFNGTVRDNLLVARPEAPEWALQEAARVAGLDGFVRDLPEGYETWIGEAGARMSAGERQRVAIARALLKDSPLLILDEPTANLDALTEKQVLESIFNWIGDRSLLMATHRLVGLDGVHQILVLKQGRIAERGSHDELLKAGGIYTRMWELQTHLLV